MYRRIKASYPYGFKSEDEWDEVLGKMIFSLEWVLKDGSDEYYALSEEEKAEVGRSMMKG